MKQVHYDKMDLANPPKGVKLAICPNCRLLGRVRRGKGRTSTTYVHTGEISGWGGLSNRYYCKLSDDGSSMEVAIPVLPAEEKHVLQQDNPL